jgi:uncharacterized Zn finger protein (UPF0148 family)
MTQKTEIVFEVEETFVLKQGGKIVAGHCPRCREDLDLVSPDILALATGTREREIFRLVETGKIHFDETDRLVVCPNCYKNSVTQSVS